MANEAPGAFGYLWFQQKGTKGLLVFLLLTIGWMISGLVLKYLNGECFVIRRGYETTLPVSTSFCLTVPM